MAKTIFYSLAALVCKILFCHSKISSRQRVISSIPEVIIQKNRENNRERIKKLPVTARPAVTRLLFDHQDQVVARLFVNNLPFKPRGTRRTGSIG